MSAHKDGLNPKIIYLLYNWVLVSQLICPKFTEEALIVVIFVKIS